MTKVSCHNCTEDSKAILSLSENDLVSVLSSQRWSDPNWSVEAAGSKMAGDVEQLGQVDGQKTQKGAA